jgi:hypothetical protein
MAVAAGLDPWHETYRDVGRTWHRGGNGSASKRRATWSNG